MYRKMVKNGFGYKIVQYNDNGSITIVAKIEKHGKKGYTKTIYNEITKIWFTPKCFSWFSTLKDIKRYYNIK